MNEKTLPKDADSDYSLPGRFEESNFGFREEEKSGSRGIIIASIIFAVIAAGFFSYYFANQNYIDYKIIQNTVNADPERKSVERFGVGRYGSEHAHAAIVIFVNDRKVDFGLQKYQLASKYIHFENGNSYLIHKHATGVPLQMLFDSVRIQMNQDCIVFNAGTDLKREFCSNENYTLSVFLNSKKYSDILSHEIDHGDRILITFGRSSEIPRQLAYLDSLEIFDVPKRTLPSSDDTILV